MILVEYKGLKLDTNAGIVQLKARICRMWLDQCACVFIYVIGTEIKQFILEESITSLGSDSPHLP